MRITLLIRRALGVALFASSLAWGAPLSTTGRTGISEFYLRFGLEHFPEIVKLCLDRAYCQDDFVEIAEQLERVGVYKTTSFEFLSSKELGTRPFRWGTGGVVQINRDMLFIARDGALSPFVFSDAVSFLSKVWGERLGWTEAQVQFVSYRLGSLVSYYTQRASPLEDYLKQFSFGFILNPVSALVIEDSNTHEMASTFEVPFDTHLSCGTTTGIEQPLKNLSIVTAIWTPASRVSLSQVLLTVSGTIRYKCLQVDGRMAGFTSNYQVLVDVNNKLGAWYLNLSSVRIQQNGIRPATAN